MKNIQKPLDYLRNFKDKSFNEVPFNAIDALLLCNLSYIDMTGIVSFDGSYTSFAEVDKKIRREYVFSNPVYGPVCAEMFDLMKDSRRFGHIMMGYYRDIFDEKKEIQFAAVTYLLGKDRLFIAFRGTDGNLASWKEDFNYIYMDNIPSQIEAEKYIKEIAENTDQRLYIGGHSKGGTLAVYAASKLSESAKRRILAVYSLDGIGFRKEFYETKEYKQIMYKVVKIVPEESFVGRVFDLEPFYKIVKSDGSGMNQHDFMNWLIDGKRFVYVNSFPSKIDSNANRLNRWIKRLSKEQIKQFIDVLFGVLGSADVDYIDAFFVNPMKYIKAMLNTFKSLKKEDRTQFLHTAFQYINPLPL